MFPKDALFYEGTQKLQKLMNTEIAVLRTFVQIYRLKNLNLILTCNTNTGRYWHKFCCKNTSTLYCTSYLPFWSVLETVLFVFSTINQTQAVYIDWTAPQCDSCIRNCHLTASSIGPHHKSKKENVCTSPQEMNFYWNKTILKEV